MLWLDRKCVCLIQLQWREHHHRLKVLAVAEDTNIQYFTITFWNHLKYLNYLYNTLSSPHPSFCLRLLCCILMFFCCLLSSLLTDTGFAFFLRSTAEKPTYNHLLISAQIPAPPAVWMGLAFDFDIFFFAPNATIQASAGVSHPPVLSMQMLSFHDAQMANKIKYEFKGEGEGEKKKWS